LVSQGPSCHVKVAVSAKVHTITCSIVGLGAISPDQDFLLVSPGDHITSS